MVGEVTSNYDATIVMEGGVAQGGRVGDSSIDNHIKAIAVFLNLIKHGFGNELYNAVMTLDILLTVRMPDTKYKDKKDLLKKEYNIGEDNNIITGNHIKYAKKLFEAQLEFISRQSGKDIVGELEIDDDMLAEQLEVESHEQTIPNNKEQAVKSIL
jgi:hypothetical protein